ncbi:MAG: hypothetical protein EAY66_01115 [Sphingobacteriales bacterium]|nr:MAG: hypothetical protein EAY66_01115 [Sphingobacteriales bacterium]
MGLIPLLAFSTLPCVAVLALFSPDVGLTPLSSLLLLFPFKSSVLTPLNPPSGRGLFLLFTTPPLFHPLPPQPLFQPPPHPLFQPPPQPLFQPLLNPPPQPLP